MENLIEIGFEFNSQLQFNSFLEFLNQWGIILIFKFKLNLKLKMTI